MENIWKIFENTHFIIRIYKEKRISILSWRPLLVITITIFFVLAGSLVAGSMFALPGFFLPRLALVVLKKRRLQKFNDQLVEALLTLTNALRSGFSLPKAFMLIATDMPKPICQEFGILVQELRLGIEVEEGLLNMLDRVPSLDLDLMTTSVGISNSVGGNLAEVFDRIAETIRERHRIEGRIDARALVIDVGLEVHAGSWAGWWRTGGAGVRRLRSR